MQDRYRHLDEKPLATHGRTIHGSSTDLTAPKFDFRFTPENGLKSDISPCPKSATTRLMHRSNDEAMSSFRQACGLQSPGGYLIAEFWA